MFITVEGIEGAGKSTAIAVVQAACERAGRDTTVTREPGGTPLGEQIREILLHRADLRIEGDAETLLVFSARAQHIADVIRPALAAGRVVICDRFTDATYAYQGGGRGLPDERIRALETWTQGALRPDLTLLLDVAPDVGLRRARGRSGPDRFEREAVAFFERVRARYLARAANEPKRFVVIDAGAPLDEVHTCVADAVIRGLRG